MTKEEIFEKEIRKAIKDAEQMDYDRGGELVEVFQIEEAVYKILSLSKQRSIEFGVWLHNNWQNILGHGWILQKDAMRYWDIDEVMKHLIPITEVYEIFTQKTENQ